MRIVILQRSNTHIIVKFDNNHLIIKLDNYMGVLVY